MGAMHNFFIDTHTHLDFPQYDTILDSVIQEAEEKGVKYYINPGTSLETITKIIKLAQKYENIFAAVGYHPHEADKIDKSAVNDVKRLLAEPKVVAIGEVGLDYFKSRVDPAIQRKLLVDFLEMALAKEKPVIIHNREADDDMLAILRDFSQLRDRFVIHCFSSTPQVAEKFLELGSYISFTGNITYPKAENIRESSAVVPLDRIMVETDSPFLAPQTYRGRVNNPSYVVEVAKQLAAIKNVSEEEIKKQTTLNAIKFFKLPI